MCTYACCLGESKGYGFVEYVSKETALHAKNVLDRKAVDDQMLCCDWLDSSHVTLESLHSKCLFVDHLPKDFRDMGQFRKVFSAVVSPPYCQVGPHCQVGMHSHWPGSTLVLNLLSGSTQIALKNGCPQDWGLVEYSSAEDAEAAQASLNGYTLGGQAIRVSFYMPGVRAINLYLKLLNESVRTANGRTSSKSTDSISGVLTVACVLQNNKKSCGLLPDPTAPAVFQQLQTLAKQNPVCTYL